MGPAGQLYAPADMADAGMVLVAGSVATASTDGTRMVTGTSRGCGTSCSVAEGPFVLTDARDFDRYGWTTWFYTVASGTACNLSCIFGGVLIPADAGVTSQVLLGVSSYRNSTATYELPSQVSGARYYVPPGTRLCVCGVPTTTTAGWQASWAGFVPYQ